MKRALIGFAAVAALSGCYVAPGPGPYGGPGPYAGPAPYAAPVVGYDAFYDGFYGGGVYDGYWGNDGIYVYRTRVGGPWVRDNGRHFVRRAGPGFRPFHVPARPDHDDRHPVRDGDHR